MSPDLAPVTAQCLAAATAVRHGFFTRAGGVSTGIYAALNCGHGSADDGTAVTENRVRVAHWLGAAEARLETVHQVHGTDVVVLERPLGEGGAPRADALVSRTPGLALTVLTADCAPVLFADPAAGVVGAAHAGWRGALAGVTDSTIDAMCRLGAEAARVRAAVGPCIAQPSYEVGSEFRAAFLEAAADSDRYFQPAARAGHYQFDLPGYLVDRLRVRGLAAVECLDQDTYASSARFFSYRRATHRGEPDYGRAAAAILLA
ncbi:MAG: peptidoglycan editing factor PgeF [Alphaproteobacteria bacterium]|jgi:hypothetical protein|nr:peptidoglycan editing factor PgeF [Alphaproteobacteria bacterium]